MARGTGPSPCGCGDTAAVGELETGATAGAPSPAASSVASESASCLARFQFRASIVLGPTMPSICKLLFVWKALTAAVVLAPYTPSAGPTAKPAALEHPLQSAHVGAGRSMLDHYSSYRGHSMRAYRAIGSSRPPRQTASTVMRWCPDAPSGRGLALSSVCTSPVPSVARTAIS